MTDPVRTPDPVLAAARLPRGAGVIYRHFGAPDRAVTARRLAHICRKRRLTLLIAADPALAWQVRADGVHWPERLLKPGRPRKGVVSAAVHGAAGLKKAAAAGADLALLSSIFPSRSPSAGKPLGPARARALIRDAKLPVYALGGVNSRNARLLARSGFAGLAAIDGLVSCETSA